MRRWGVFRESRARPYGERLLRCGDRSGGHGKGRRAGAAADCLVYRSIGHQRFRGGYPPDRDKGLLVERKR